ncbi:FCD domain-containing protein [Paraglaciecola psychrophila]|uniref:Pyruvate dehydrogenase complex repressor n=1 Tax=Paraglaciecola psychrophila 170 TaxID=1129794 RepID=K6ZVJ8_9ALTE|nr:GntR family transcriptional regulator [Paraglaciecola psychrophila]AGH43562.1 GntR family transcriptional regulator [Paraglaciecola psychrophila 170]GAC39911.1 GntR family transcriptional regulator, transcriptional repressor for pyruvate dehydrogenase complex [Paraglaciecola psychrophila 170]
MRRVQSRKLSDDIMEQLEAMILDGRLLAGQKLLSERTLAEQFAVSRPSVREAIQKLENKNLVERKQGGGTFVKPRLNELITDPLLLLLSDKPEMQFDLLEFRHALEGMAAYYAALRGQPEDYEALESALEALPDDSTDKSQQAIALVNFYLTMANAAHNMVLQHVMRSLQSMLQDNIQRNLEVLAKHADAAQNINKQRRNIVKAILAGDPEQARKASNEHLAYIEDTLLNINRQDMRMQRALRRIEVN